MEKSIIWLGSVVVECNDFPRMMAFLAGSSPLCSPRASRGKPLNEYRLHLDLYTADPEKEVERLLRLGATLKRPAEKGKDSVTLVDPDDNLFDVIDKKGWHFGRRA